MSVAALFLLFVPKKQNGRPMGSRSGFLQIRSS